MISSEWQGITVAGDPARVIELTLVAEELSGRIPEQIGNLSGLEVLDLRDNRLAGSIPIEIDRLTGLQWLDLSGNQLTGCVPAEFLGNQQVNINDLDLPYCGETTEQAEPTERALAASQSQPPVEASPSGGLRDSDRVY